MSIRAEPFFIFHRFHRFCEEFGRYKTGNFISSVFIDDLDISSICEISTELVGP